MGLLTAGVAIAVAHLVAGFVGREASPVIAVGSTAGGSGTKKAYHPIMTSADSTMARIRLRLLSSIGSPELPRVGPLQSKRRLNVKRKAPAGRVAARGTDLMECALIRRRRGAM